MFMNQDQEGSRSPDQQLAFYQKRLSFMKNTLTEACIQLRERGLLTPEVEEYYQSLLAKLDLDEELLEPELVDALSGILSDREKEIQDFINSANR